MTKNHKHLHENINNIILIAILIIGLFLILKPEKPIVSSQNNITVINIKKANTLPSNKIIGIILIVTSLSFLFLIKKYTPKEVNTSKREELTVQQKKIYDLLKKGNSNKEIAAELNISISTVKTHINHIFKKLNISKRNQLFD